MRPTDIRFNLTVDDFDSLITYPDQSQWLTPDPSAAHDPALDIWFDDTYHLTNVTGASLSFDFKGSEFYLFGGSGPSFGSYEVEIDGRAHKFTANAVQNSSQHLLFSTASLRYADHTVKVTNLGAKHHSEGNDFLLDFVKTTVNIAPAGATLTNTTLEETNSQLVYTGNWTENVFNPLFSGGFSRFTNDVDGSVSLSFHATSIFIFGDKTDRHGLYNVTLDGRTQTFNGVSGCGGAFAHACEKDNTLAFFAANLDESLHTVKVQNIPGELGAFFDLDAIVLTTPSKYLHKYASQEVHIVRRTSAAARVGDPSLHLLLFFFFLGLGLARRFRW